jgi:hypothetical protein
LLAAYYTLNARISWVQKPRSGNIRTLVMRVSATTSSPARLQYQRGLHALGLITTIAPHSSPYHRGSRLRGLNLDVGESQSSGQNPSMVSASKQSITVARISANRFMVLPFLLNCSSV